MSGMFRKLGNSFRRIFEESPSYCDVFINGEKSWCMTKQEALSAIEHFEHNQVKVKFHPVWDSEGMLIAAHASCEVDGDSLSFMNVR